MGLLSEDKVNRSITYGQAGHYYSFLINSARHLKCLLIFLRDFYAIKKKKAFLILLIGLGLHYEVQRLSLPGEEGQLIQVEDLLALRHCAGYIYICYIT